MKIFLQRDGAFERCNSLCDQVLSLGRAIAPEELAVRIDAVDAGEVHRVAYKYLHDSEISLAALGPAAGIPQYCDLRTANNMKRF